MVTKYQVIDVLTSEKAELDIKIKNNSAFIAQPGLLISADELKLIQDQIKAMTDYSKALKARIEYINVEGLSKVKLGKVTVKYVDESNDSISEDKIITGTVGSAFSENAITVEGYHIKEGGQTTLKGTFLESDQTITFIYSKDVPLQGISLDPNKATIAAGETVTTVPSFTPDNATDKSVVFSSDDTTIATVDNKGKITALKAGETTIKCTSKDGAIIATFALTVTEPALP